MFTKTILSLATLAGIIATSTAANAQSYERRAYCDDYARRASYRGPDGSNIAGGAIGGAVAGGVLGAIIGNGRGDAVGTGALIGGVTGGALGAADNRGHFDHRAYQYAFSRCMNGANRWQGNQYVDQPIYRHPMRHRDRAVEYCMARYRSYDPQSGMYLSYQGDYRPCP